MVAVNAWQEYLATAQRLDTVRKAATKTAADEAAAVKAARQELAGVRARLARQQAALLDTARQAGSRTTVLAPGPAELAAARATLTPTTPQRVRAQLPAALAALDTADAMLSGDPLPGAPRRSPALRNASVYGAYAVFFALLQLAAFVAFDDRRPVAQLGVIVCGLVFPLLAFGLGWVTVGAFGRSPGATTIPRTPLAGAAASLLALLPQLLWIIRSSTSI